MKSGEEALLVCLRVEFSRVSSHVQVENASPASPHDRLIDALPALSRVMAFYVSAGLHDTEKTCMCVCVCVNPWLIIWLSADSWTAR